MSLNSNFTVLRNTEHRAKAQRFGLLAAGVLLGVTTGLGLNSNLAAHADTVDNTNSDNNTQLVSDHNENAKPYAQIQNEAADQTNQNNNDNDSSDDQNANNADQHKITISYQLPDGEKVKDSDIFSREGLESNEDYYTGSPWESGKEVSLYNLRYSSFSDFDVQSIKDNQGNKYDGTMQMPDHDVHLTVTIAPTGDRSTYNDALNKVLNDYQKEHGLPSKVFHQAYGGKSQAEVDKEIKDEADKVHQIDEEENGHKGSSNDNSGSSSNVNNNSSSSDDNNTNSADKNGKKVTLTFNIFYNGTKFGTETIKDAVPGTKYDAKNIDKFQNLLKQRGLTLDPASLAKVSGTVPNDDQTYDLQVIKAGGDHKSAGQGETVNQAAKDSLGENANDTTSAADNSGSDSGNGMDSLGDDAGNSDDGSDGGYTNGNANNGDFDRNLDYSGGANDDGNGNGQSTSGDQPGSANNQSLPQTGSQHKVMAIAALGLMTVGLGAGLLKKRNA